MRKVFLSIIILGEIKKTKYSSDNFELVNEEYNLPMSYIIDSNVEDGEEITVITCVEKTKTGNGIAENNYHLFQNEVEYIAQKHHLKVVYDEIALCHDFDNTTFNYFFKTVAKKFNNGDELYLDISFGMKPYNISLFIAVAYAIKACINATVACAFYSQKFSGSKSAQDVDESKLYNLTGLFYLNDFAAKVQPGDKVLADSMLDIMMPDKE